VVHGRKKNDRLDEFGVSGYVYKDTFLIYDRKTESLWYPFDHAKWTAVSGPRQGETISFDSEPDVVKLGEWRAQHPETVVLLGSKSEVEAAAKAAEEKE
jgi:hypothetical protein